jgi:hypothetical protein
MTRWADEAYARLMASRREVSPYEREEMEREKARQSQQARIRRRLERVL